MNIKVNQPPGQIPQKQTSNQTNPPLNNLNPQPQLQTNLETIVEEVLKKYLQNVQQNINNKTNASNTLQNQQLNSEEYIIKSQMKSSYVAARVGQLLMLRKKTTLSAMGFAIPILIDSILLIRKDLGKLGKEVSISNIELFEREVTNGQKTKLISGIRVTLSI